MSEKKKTQKLVLIVAVPSEQQLIDEIGFVKWLEDKRAELMGRWKATSVTIMSFGKMIYNIGVERTSEEIDAVGFSRYLFNLREELSNEYMTKQVFVVAV